MNIPNHIINTIIMMARPTYPYTRQLQAIYDRAYDSDEEDEETDDEGLKMTWLETYIDSIFSIIKTQKHNDRVQLGQMKYYYKQCMFIIGNDMWRFRPNHLFIRDGKSF